jgi:hypothetical protein
MSVTGEEDLRPEAQEVGASDADPLAWVDRDDPRRTRFPEEWTTPPKLGAGHTLCGPRCQGTTAAGERCRGPASIIENGKLVCSRHVAAKVRGPRGGSLKDRLRSRADQDYDALEDELLSLAQFATSKRTFTCSGCKKKNTVEVADAAVRLRAIEAVLDRTGAARATAATAASEDRLTGSTTLADIQAMSRDELVRLHDYLVASDPDALARTMQRHADYEALKSEYGSARVVERALFSRNDEETLRRIYETLRDVFEPKIIAA